MSGDFQVALAGSVSAALSTIAVYPLDTLKTYLNKGSDEEGKDLKTVNDVILKVVLRRGNSMKSLKSLYSGIGSKIFMTMTQKFLYFYIYNFLMRIVKRSNGKVSMFMNLLIGYSSALVAVAILTPLEISQTMQQLDQNDNRSILDILRDIFLKEGFAGLYKGLQTNIILCVNPAIEYTVFDQLKKILLKRSGTTHSLTDAEAFWLGACSKAVATIATFPHVRAKVLQQAGVKGYSKMDSTSILVALLVREGPYSWFAGLKAQLVKNVIASAIMMSAKERIERSVINFRST